MPDPGRLRRIPQQFSWVDHRLVRHGHLRHCGDTSALALYLFLVTVGDAQGLSYYSESRLIEHLPLSIDEVRTARKRLVATGLIAYRKPFYQVLGLDGSDVLEIESEARRVPAPAPAPALARKQSQRSRQHSSAGTDGDGQEGERFEDPVTIKEALRATLEMLASGGGSTKDQP